MFTRENLLVKIFASLLLIAAGGGFFIIFCGWKPDAPMITMALDSRSIETTLLCLPFSLIYGIAALPLSRRDYGFLLLNLLSFALLAVLRGVMNEFLNISLIWMLICIGVMLIGVGISLIVRHILRYMANEYGEYMTKRMK